jgi:hypothetical protein
MCAHSLITSSTHRLLASAKQLSPHPPEHPRLRPLDAPARATSISQSLARDDWPLAPRRCTYLRYGGITHRKTAESCASLAAALAAALASFALARTCTSAGSNMLSARGREGSGRSGIPATSQSRLGWRTCLRADFVVTCEAEGAAEALPSGAPRGPPAAALRRAHPTGRGAQTAAARADEAEPARPAAAAAAGAAPPPSGSAPRGSRPIAGSGRVYRWGRRSTRARACSPTSARHAARRPNEE